MKMMMRGLLTLGLILWAGPGWAHGSLAAFYGGQIAESGDWRIEFAVRDGKVRVWVRDHADAAVAATGKAVLLAAGRKLELALTPAPDGQGLEAEAALRAADKVTAVLSLTVAGAPLSVRFAQDAVTEPPLSPQAAAGKAAFTAVCATCHGTALRGTDNGPPLLHPFYGAGGGHGDAMLLAAMGNGAAAHHWKFGDMPKPKGLKPGQDAEVLAFVRAMQAANGIGGGGAATMDHSQHGGGHSGH